MYPCDNSGQCPYGDGEGMYFCRDHCGLGVDDAEESDEIIDLEELAEPEEVYEVIGSYTVSNCIGIEILKLDDDYVTYRWCIAGDDAPRKAEVSTIFYDSEDEDGEDGEIRPYFLAGKMKVYLDECMRVGT